MKDIFIIHGPNLNLLGRREPHLYGHVSFDDFLPKLKAKYPRVSIHYFQSNHEGRLIDKLQEIGFAERTGIVLNAAAYTHTSIALGDTIAAISVPVVEVHISDIMTREAYRQKSFVKPHAVHFISGMGLEGYEKAIDYLISLG